MTRPGCSHPSILKQDIIVEEDIHIPVADIIRLYVCFASTTLLGMFFNCFRLNTMTLFFTSSVLNSTLIATLD